MKKHGPPPCGTNNAGIRLPAGVAGGKVFVFMIPSMDAHGWTGHVQWGMSVLTATGLVGVPGYLLPLPVPNGPIRYLERAMGTSRRTQPVD
jgi:hypothetical protein